MTRDYVYGNPDIGEHAGACRERGCKMSCNCWCHHDAACSCRYCLRTRIVMPDERRAR